MAWPELTWTQVTCVQGGQGSPAGPGVWSAGGLSPALICWAALCLSFLLCGMGSWGLCKE